jgi:hypothetical protein
MKHQECCNHQRELPADEGQMPKLQQALLVNCYLGNVPTSRVPNNQITDNNNNQ